MADLVGASTGSTISKHERGLTFPSPEYIEAYRKVSHGKVQFEDWIDLRGGGAASENLQAAE